MLLGQLHAGEPRSNRRFYIVFDRLISRRIFMF